MAHHTKKYIPVYRVRCLGPGVEHTFLSQDPRRNRLCARCARALSEKIYSPMMDKRLKTPKPARINDQIQ